MMKTIAIFPNIDKPESAGVLKRIVDFFADKEVRLMMPEATARLCGYPELGVQGIGKQNVDIGLSIGGDGTLLGVCRQLYAKNIPAAASISAMWAFWQILRCRSWKAAWASF